MDARDRNSMYEHRQINAAAPAAAGASVVDSMQQQKQSSSSDSSQSGRSSVNMNLSSTTAHAANATTALVSDLDSHSVGIALPPIWFRKLHRNNRSG